MAMILAVDDDRAVLELINESLNSTGAEVVTKICGQDALDWVANQSPDVILLDVKLPDVSGLEMVESIRTKCPQVPIIMITVSTSSDVTIEAIQKGAFEFLTKPLDTAIIQDVVQRALAMRKMQVPVRVESTSDDSSDVGLHDSMIGKCPKMLEVYKEIGRVASKDVTVLICGESGTGKELVARAIYQHSSRRDRPFLAVNCAALTDTLLESELFGHEKGSFTGADKRRIGKFEQCSGGTIFLDEVGDMSPVLQSKILRLLQDQQFERVGGVETISTDVRIISATNRDLQEMIRDNEFRLDLYHRLNSYRIDLPPLREREDDIELLVQHILKRLAKELKIERKGISPEAMELLKRRNWPGNIRQLQTVLKRALLKSTAAVLVPADLPSEFAEDGTGHTSTTALANDAQFGIPSDLRPFIDERRQFDSRDLYTETQTFMERYLITRVLKENEGNQSKTADELGISRGRLRNKIRALGINIEHIVSL